MGRGELEEAQAEKLAPDDETIIVSEDHSAEVSPHEAGVGGDCASTLEQLQMVFQHLPGARDVLADISVGEGGGGGTDAVVNEVVNRLMTLPVIERIIGERREHLAAIVGSAVSQGMRPVRDSMLNMVVLADPTQERYGLLRPLGTGAFGYVAEVEFDSPLEVEEEDPYGAPEFVAKLLLDTGADSGGKIFQRFQSEQLTLSAIRSGAPSVYGEGITREGRPYFIMRNIQGQDFHDIVRSINQALQEDEANNLQWPSRWMYLALASASQTMHEIHHPEGAVEVVTDNARLSHLHDTADLKRVPVGVIHRDIKPSNIRVDTEGRVWILDFGLVRPMDDENERSRLTITGQVIGTPHYMAPEQSHDSKNNITPAADVYAMGCVAFEMLAGMPPFAHKEKVLQVLTAHQKESPNLDLIPNPGAREIVRRMMHKDPAKRPNLGQVARDFHALFLEGAGEEERQAYANFLSLPHVERTLPMPDGLDFSAGGGSCEEEAERALSLTRSLVVHGGDALPDASSSLPEVYVVGKGGELVKFTNMMRLQRWMKQHQLFVNVGAVAAAVAAVLIPLAVHFSLRKPDTRDPTALVERVPTSSVGLDMDDEGLVVGIALFDRSPAHIPAGNIATVKAAGRTVGAFFHLDPDQIVVLMDMPDGTGLPNEMQKKGANGMLLLHGSEDGQESAPVRVVYLATGLSTFLVDDGSGRLRMFTDNATLRATRSAECAHCKGQDDVYDDPIFRAVVDGYIEADEAIGEVAGTRGRPLTTVNGQVLNGFRKRIEERRAQDVTEKVD